MTNQEFTATRTMLANAMATAGAELLQYMKTAGALAAIPNTDPQQYVVAGTLQIIGKLLPAVEQGARAAYGQWISMGDRLPDDAQLVLIYCPDPEPGMWPAQWAVGSQTFESSENGWVAGNEVTYWMPLPQPPEAASNENSQRGSEA